MLHKDIVAALKSGVEFGLCVLTGEDCESETLSGLDLPVKYDKRVNRELRGYAHDLRAAAKADGHDLTEDDCERFALGIQGHGVGLWDTYGPATHANMLQCEKDSRSSYIGFLSKRGAFVTIHCG